MASPDTGDVHVNALLTNVSIAYKNQEYIADQIFPLVGVDKQSNIIASYDKSYWFRDDAQLRAPGGDLHYGEYKVDNSTLKYFCDNYNYAKAIAYETRDNADPVFDMERDTTLYVTDKLQLRREVAFGTDFMASGKWGTDSTPANLWSDYGNSDPFANIATARVTIRQATGRYGNKMVMGDAVWQILKNHPDMLDRIKYGATPGSPAVVTKQLVAAVAELDDVMVFSAIKTTSAEGTAEASATYADVVAKQALVIYVPSNPGILVPSAGYTFFWRPAVGGGPQFVRRFEDLIRKRTVVDAHSYFDQKLMAAAAGYSFNSVVA